MNTSPRKGDAYLKNLGMVYDDSIRPELAPPYDIVTAGAWIPGDLQAIPFGPRSWLTPKNVMAFGATAYHLSRPVIRRIMRRCEEAIQATRPLLKTTRREFPQVPAPQRLKHILSRRKVGILPAHLGAAAPYCERASDCCGA